MNSILRGKAHAHLHLELWLMSSFNKNRGGNRDLREVWGCFLEYAIGSYRLWKKLILCSFLSYVPKHVFMLSKIK